MAIPKEAPRPLPPYVPYRTFLNFIASLRQGMPGRIDRTLMANMSGAMQSQLFGALRYLSLINEQDVPQPIFEQLVETSAEEQQQVLRTILEDSYPFLLSANGFSLANATLGQFEEQFKKTGASGDTVRKCAAFFLAAAKDAEIPISPRIAKSTRPRSATKPRPTRPRAAPQPSKRPGTATDQSHTSSYAQPANSFSVPTHAGSTKTVKLRGGGSVTLVIDVDWFSIEEDDRAFVLGLVDTVKEYEQLSPSDEEEAEDDNEGEGYSQ